MIIKKTKFEGLLIIKQRKNTDSRGSLREIFNKKTLKKRFVFDYCTTSKGNVLRGFHFQTKFQQSKYVNVLKGKILDVVVDIRKYSKFYGESFSIELDDIHNKQLFVPRGFAHGFIVLSNIARVSYKVDNYYNPNSEEGLNYNDPKLDIDWKINKKDIIINEKDLSYSDINSIDFI